MNVHAKHLWLTALKQGASAVFAAEVDSEADRVRFEADLINQYRPVLNTQHNPKSPLGLVDQSRWIVSTNPTCAAFG